MIVYLSKDYVDNMLISTDVREHYIELNISLIRINLLKLFHYNELEYHKFMDKNYIYIKLNNLKSII